MYNIKADLMQGPLQLDQIAKGESRVPSALGFLWSAGSTMISKEVFGPYL